MNVFTFSVCCLMALYLIIPAESAPPKACCLVLSSMPLKPNRVKDYHIQQKGTLCPIQAAVLLTVKDRRVCADPNSPWVIDAMTKVNNKKEAAKAGTVSGPTIAPSGGENRPSGKRRGKGRGGRGGKGRGKGGRRAGRQHTQQPS
ncbi:hypothetical protein ACEWY4_019034 [Coilia grayii]|uniref:C-C motif chemokine n=1 Tax=Coilia grayii TaxID=363190 RepID=A0ABD1JEW0_9TELE